MWLIIIIRELLMQYEDNKKKGFKTKYFYNKKIY